MNLRLLITITLSLLVSASSGQGHPGGGERGEKIRALKIAYITEKLQLTPEEAQVFWPVFNEYESKKFAEERALASEVDDKAPDIALMSDQEVDQFITQRLEKEQRIINLKKEYYVKLKEVLPVKKVFRLFEAEAGFKKMLLERLQNNPERPYDNRR
jgi:hypothetical protein